MVRARVYLDLDVGFERKRVEAGSSSEMFVDEFCPSKSHVPSFNMFFQLLKCFQKVTAGFERHETKLCIISPR